MSLFPVGAFAAGRWVEVRDASEILATLDDDGTLEGLPFMAEMLQFCGRRLRVLASAHKTCDTITKSGGRRMNRAVHLDTSCDGSAHGGCQARCELFWKVAWLRPVGGPNAVGGAPSSGDVSELPEFQRLARMGTGQDPITPGDPLYSCQATTLLRATSPLHWWDPRQYFLDLLSGNVRLFPALRVFAIAAFNAAQRWRGGAGFPHLPEGAKRKTPGDRLDLAAGELVQIRSRDEIAATLDRDQRNRGLRFDVEQLRFCGGTYRVRERVERIIDEHTGKMLHFSTDSIMLEGVHCCSELSAKRLFCPRRIPSYWREGWLRRVPSGESPDDSSPAPSQAGAA
jgi:hypothetical protein